MSLPLVSVITCTLNAASTVARALESVRCQDYPFVEHIVVDGVSTDGTIDILRAYGGSTRWTSERDSGIYDAWNKALTQSKGEWICFLGADDYFADPGAISRMVAGTLGDKKKSLAVYSRIRLVDGDGKFLYDFGKPWPEVAKQFCQVMSIPHPGLLHHRSLFEMYGPFDPSYRIAGDYEFLLRHLRSNGALFVDGPPIVVMTAGGISGAPGQSIRVLREMRHAQVRHGFLLPGASWLFAMFKVYVRQGIAAIAGDRQLKKIVDFKRRLGI